MQGRVAQAFEFGLRAAPHTSCAFSRRVDCLAAPVVLRKTQQRWGIQSWSGLGLTWAEGAVPPGLGSLFIELTPDLRPGLLYAAPSTVLRAVSPGLLSGGYVQFTQGYRDPSSGKQRPPQDDKSWW